MESHITNDIHKASFELAALPPLTLYVHIPWCVRKCPYCDFNSHAMKLDLPEDQYIDALLSDLEQDLPLVWGRRVSSVFIGGGTPSLFSASAIERLLSGIRARIPCNPTAEITLEANPGTVEQEKFREFRAAGINRLSLGIQSFSDTQLQALGRIHSAKEARHAVEVALAAGFDKLNLDLMFGLPGQSLADARADVAQAIAFNPTHISYYQLTIEPNTLFYSQPPTLPDDEFIWQIQEQGQILLAEHGYEQYEISAYARHGHQCAHNLNYWRFGDYLGIGAGAHGKISDAQQQHIMRIAKTRHPEQYLQNIGKDDRVTSRKVLSPEDVRFEFMLNALRLLNGVTVEEFEHHTGLTLSNLDPQRQQAQQRGLLEVDPQRIAPTSQGVRYLNDLLQLFLPEALPDTE